MRAKLATNRLDLPVELEREIFELAASTDVGTALRLATVARRVQAWVEPIIYSRVVVAHAPEVDRIAQQSRAILAGRIARVHASKKTPKEAQIPRFIRTIPLRPASFFSRHVKSLHVGNLTEPELVAALSACTGISELGWWSATVDPAVAAALHSLRLLRLSVDHSFDFARLTTPHLLSTLTHLDLVFHNSSHPTFPLLEHFTALTHFSIAHSWILPPLTWCDDVFEACPRLKILLRFSDNLFYEELSGLRPRHANLRVVVMIQPVGSWTTRWVHDAWPLAEDVVRERHAHAAGMSIVVFVLLIFTCAR
ncbi:hypothetical protein C8F04DRAFT_1157365 [Mycena alexandri]|uniref:Uncharacterized protein n=1 Tax=Mycena alexandri TaxID=1745969 RepID=A0AAD6WLQ4_9AGAR|nr:hypothetical protein C8F04DRAFT_1157365 [Mycena alexandri]